jgi:glyoxylate reductase
MAPLCTLPKIFDELSNMKTILLTHPLPSDWIASLEGRVDLIVGPDERPGWAANLLEALPRADGILSVITARVDESLLEKTPNLRVVSNMAVGVDNIDIAACTKRGIPVGNTPGAMTDATADLTMLLLLAAARKLCPSRRGTHVRGAG